MRKGWALGSRKVESPGGRIRGESHHSVFKSSATEKRPISGEMHLLAQIMETGGEKAWLEVVTGFCPVIYFFFLCEE